MAEIIYPTQNSPEELFIKFLEKSQIEPGMISDIERKLGAKEDEIVDVELVQNVEELHELFGNTYSEFLSNLRKFGVSDSLINMLVYPPNKDNSVFPTRFEPDLYEDPKINQVNKEGLPLLGLTAGKGDLDTAFVGHVRFMNKKRQLWGERYRLNVTVNSLKRAKHFILKRNPDLLESMDEKDLEVGIMNYYIYHEGTHLLQRARDYTESGDKNEDHIKKYIP